MSTFQDFFPDKISSPQEEEKSISARLPAFRARAIDEGRASAIRRASARGPGGQIDEEENLLALVLACVTYPDLENAQLQSAWGTIGAQSLIRKMLLPGEYNRLSQWVLELCGFDTDMNQLAEQAKN